MLFGGVCGVCYGVFVLVGEINLSSGETSIVDDDDFIGYTQ